MSGPAATLRPAWLTARPIAHRGLHDRAAGLIENTAAAARAAIAGNFTIECDVQLSKDGQAMVFHDETLERLTGAHGRTDALDAAALAQIPLRDSTDTIPALPDFLAEIAGRVPLVIEIKSEFTGDMRLAERAAQCASAYAGPVALKSFDPAIMAHLRENRATLGLAHVPLGMVAEARYDHAEWNFLSAAQKQSLTHFLHWQDTQPDFLSYSVGDFPNAVPHLLRGTIGLPVMTWTVRTQAQREIAAIWADQVVFEGWRPEG